MDVIKGFTFLVVLEQRDFASTIDGQDKGFQQLCGGDEYPSK